MTVARLFQQAPKAKEAQPTPAPAKLARSPRSARDPRFMRSYDRVQLAKPRPEEELKKPLARAKKPEEELKKPIARAKPRPEEELKKPIARAKNPEEELKKPLQKMSARISSPHDPAEQEAEAMARNVAAMSHPGDAPSVSNGSHGGAGGESASSETMHEIVNAHPLGRPLPTSVRQFMEPRFGADFRGVRIHTGAQSAKLNRRLNARAFTVGHQVFFGDNTFRPESHEGRELIAHELTHTIQQGAAPQLASQEVHRSPDPEVHRSPHLQRLGKDDALDWLADKANIIPGWRMFTIVLGVNPINMSSVDSSTANILRAVVDFLPGGDLIVQALDKYGVFDKVGTWIDGQLKSLGITGASIKAAVMSFVDSLGAGDFLHPGRTWDRAVAIFSGPIDRIESFVAGLAAQVLQFIKDAILKPLGALAAQSDGWDLLCAVLGKNPITGEPKPPTAENLIGGFMKLIGQTEIWENIQKSGATSKAWAWFQGAMKALMDFVGQIPGLFLDALKSLTIEDIIVLPLAFAKVGKAFSGFIGRFMDWAGDTIWDLLEIIFTVAAPAVIVYVKKAAGAFKTILKNPGGFVGNLVTAGKQGLSQFTGNFVKHLKASLIGWLTGSLAGAGVYIPQALSLAEIGKFVLSILGITWPKIREKIVKVIGETAMKVIEGGLDVVLALVRGGPAAAWEMIKAKLSDLQSMVISSIISFVKDRIVTAAITKLLSMLSPVGAFIQAIIGIYNTVMFFVERMRQIAAVAASVIDSISAIANGIIGAAANKVESTMAGLLTLVISFLARIAGLGKVSDAVVGFIKKVQAKVDQAIDFGINFVVGKAKAFLALLASKVKGKDKNAAAGAPPAAAAGADPQHDAKVQKGVAELRSLEAAAAKENTIDRKTADDIAAKVKTNNPVFTSVTVADGKKTWNFEYTASPKGTAVLVDKAGQFEIVQVTYDPTTTKNLRDAASNSGDVYARAATSTYVTGTYADELNTAGYALSVSKPGMNIKTHPYGSTLGTVRLKGERPITSGPLTRQPDYTGERTAKVGGKKTIVAVDALEITLVTDFKASANPNQFAAHKSAQIPATLLLLREKYKPPINVKYRIIAPKGPSPSARAYIESILKNPQLGMPNLTIVWVILG